MFLILLLTYLRLVSCEYYDYYYNEPLYMWATYQEIGQYDVLECETRMDAVDSNYIDSVLMGGRSTSRSVNDTDPDSTCFEAMQPFLLKYEAHRSEPSYSYYPAILWTKYFVP